MTSTTAEVRPKTPTTVDFDAARNDRAQRTMTDEIAGGQDILYGWSGAHPQIMFTLCMGRPATSDTTELIVGAEPPNTSVAASGSLTSKDYQITLDRLRELKLEEDEEDQPSDYAYDRTVRLLCDVAESLGMQFRRAIIASGPNRSIRLLWTAGEREVRVTVGGSESNKSYIYWQASGRSGIENVVDAQTLRKYLSGLVQNM